MLKKPNSYSELWQGKHLTQASIPCLHKLVGSRDRLETTEQMFVWEAGLTQHLSCGGEGLGVADRAGVPWWAAWQLAGAASRVI